jgi:hypothetical protein
MVRIRCWMRHASRRAGLLARSVQQPLHKLDRRVGVSCAPASACKARPLRRDHLRPAELPHLQHGRGASRRQRHLPLQRRVARHAPGQLDRLGAPYLDGHGEMDTRALRARAEWRLGRHADHPRRWLTRHPLRLLQRRRLQRYGPHPRAALAPWPQGLATRPTSRRRRAAGERVGSQPDGVAQGPAQPDRPLVGRRHSHHARLCWAVQHVS